MKFTGEFIVSIVFWPGYFYFYERHLHATSKGHNLPSSPRELEKNSASIWNIAQYILQMCKHSRVLHSFLLLMQLQTDIFLKVSYERTSFKSTPVLRTLAIHLSRFSLSNLLLMIILTKFAIEYFVT